MADLTSTQAYGFDLSFFAALQSSTGGVAGNETQMAKPMIRSIRLKHLKGADYIRYLVLEPV